MNLNSQYTKNRRFNLRNDYFEVGEQVDYKAPVSEGLQRNPAGSYLVTGKVEIDNPNRPRQTYGPSTKRLGSGGIFSGDYTLTFLEASNVRCFHITFKKDIAMYDIKEHLLTANQSLTLSPNDGVEAFAVMIGSAMSEDGPTLPENTLIELGTNSMTIIAKTDCTINAAVKK